MKKEEAIQTLNVMQSSYAHIRHSDAEWEAVEMAKEALQVAGRIEPNKMVLLTLKQLRKMNRQPVWYRDKDEWFIIELHHPVFGNCVINSDGCYIPLEKAAKRGFYAYPIAHIDREAWGCEYCTGDVDDRPFLDSEDLYISGDGWLTSDGQDHDYCKIEYCPKCGKPLTQDAWAELEKRLRG